MPPPVSELQTMTPSMSAATSMASFAAPHISTPTTDSTSVPSHLKVKIIYGNDNLLTQVPYEELTFAALFSRVERKVRLCGGDAAVANGLRIKYQDEDGDLITIHCDEDVYMALESRKLYSGNSRSRISSEPGVLSLHVTNVGKVT